MKYMLVGDGVNTLHGKGYGPTYWINHIFLSEDAIIMGDGSISQSYISHTTLCGEYFGCLNTYDISKPDCSICVKIAVGIGKGK